VVSLGSLDMVEVGGSNPPGPTKIENPPSGGFFGFRRVGLDENRMVRHIPTQEECGRGSPQGDGAPKE